MTLTRQSRTDLRPRERAAGRAMLASGDTRKEAVTCAWCGRGCTASDDVLLALDAPISKSHGICPSCEKKVVEGER